MAKASVSPTARDRAIDAFLSLLAERSYGAIALSDVAERAGLSLADLRGTARSTFGYWVGFMHRLDESVLRALDPDLATEPVREQLFDVLMRRIDMMAPHREAIRAMRQAALRDPALLFKMNEVSVHSMAWMLEASGVAANGVSGRLKAQALAGLFMRVIEVFLEDDSAELSSTMRALDEALTRGGRAARLYDDIAGLAAPFGALINGLYSLTPFARRHSWRGDRWREDGRGRSGSYQSDDLAGVNSTLA